MEFIAKQEGFSVTLGDKELLNHSLSHPCIAVGSAESDVLSHSGNFSVKEHGLKKRALPRFRVLSESENLVEILFEGVLTMRISQYSETAVSLDLSCTDTSYNRFNLTTPIEPDAGIYGGGELFDRQNLKGSHMPLWISEPGVGRGYNLFTALVASKTKHWPKWYHTNCAMPCWLSSSGRYFYAVSSAYGTLDFRDRETNSHSFWEIPERILLGSTGSMKQAVSGLSDLLGRQPRLPQWAYDGMWIGLQGGKEVARRKIEAAKKANFALAAIWCQDWEGIRMTSFGKQLRWCWEYDETLYPDLPGYIKELNKQGIRYLAYTNTFLTPGSPMFEEADRLGYLIKRTNGENYPVYVPFDPGYLVDFTNPDACTWLKEIIKKNLIELGISGWMADFGEYIPSDSVLHSAESPLTYHNRYPADWARINYEAVKEAGKEDEVLYFMRSGAAGGVKYTSAFWTGDQLVDWSREDGLPSAINSSLMMGICSVGYVHSDVGGYTTLGYKKRSRELLIRWAEYAAFTQIMRSHEGNRPQNNVQFDEDEELLGLIGRMTRVYAALKPYHLALSKEYQDSGIPPMRMMSLEFPAERKSLEAWPYQYLYGPDLLCAPVIKKGKRSQSVRLPSCPWIHLWSGKRYEGGSTVVVDAPFGQPPVFYREGSGYESLFEGVRSC